MADVQKIGFCGQIRWGPINLFQFFFILLFVWVCARSISFSKDAKESTVPSVVFVSSQATQCLGICKTGDVESRGDKREQPLAVLTFFKGGGAGEGLGGVVPRSLASLPPLFLFYGKTVF